MPCVEVNEDYFDLEIYAASPLHEARPKNSTDTFNNAPHLQTHNLAHHPDNVLRKSIIETSPLEVNHHDRMSDVNLDSLRITLRFGRHVIFPDS